SCQLAVMELDAQNFQRVIKFRSEQEGEEGRVKGDVFKYDILQSVFKRHKSDTKYRNKLEHQGRLECIFQDFHRLSYEILIILFQRPSASFSRPCVTTI